MAEYIDRQAFLEEQRHLYCENCEKRKGMKRGKKQFVYEIGDAPCRSCGYGDVLDDLEDFPAADAIEQLSNAGSAYGRGWTLGYDAGREEGKPRWIPVTERLPDAGRYLALTPPFTNGGKPVARILHFSKNLESVDRYDFEGINRSGWYYYDDEYGNIEVDTVTHWMPLPQPPKEE